MPWFWNGASGRYKDETGRFLSRDDALDRVQKSIDASTNAVGHLSSLLGDGLIAPKDWHTFMKREVKSQFITQYMLASGGRANMAFSDWGRVGRMLRDQYKYLGGFLRDVLTGNMAPGQIMVRAGMYMSAARGAYEKATELQAAKNGCDEELWVLGVAEHCVDCIGNADMD